MRVGVQLPEIERIVRWPELETMATRIEDLGFDSLWVGDHLLYELDGERKGPWEAWALLAALGAVTRRVTLGPLVAALPFHPPAVLAKMAATVDEISGGRLVLGLGAGWNRVEFEAFGLPFAHRVARFAEGFEIIRRLLKGERVDHRGDFYQLDGCELLPRPDPKRRIPLMIGSTGPRMLEITLPHVDSWNGWFARFGNDPRQLSELLERLDRICRRVGRDPATLERSVAVLVQLGPRSSRRNSINPIVGSPRGMASSLRAFGDLGIAEVQLVLDPISLESIEQVGEVKALL